MNDSQEHPDSVKLMQKLRQAGGQSGQLNYKDFIELCLYDPQFGYYRKSTTRVGRSDDADFYTSQSLGSVFGDLVTDAVRQILENQGGKTIDLKDWTFVEVGYETDSEWWKDNHCPFGRVIRVGLGDVPSFSGSCVLFSNELFDAQPFHRIVFLNNQWGELGVDVSHGTLKEVLLPVPSEEVQAFRHQLPIYAEEGYILDLPLATKPLLNKLTDLPWDGLFLALDYGKSWNHLINDFPQGTARAYFKHNQFTNLLVQPGMQDITCHICWDWLETSLKEAGFENTALESQEAFFVKHASDCIEKIITANPENFDPLRQSLIHLIHPATMGQQFQVLWGFRRHLGH